MHVATWDRLYGLYIVQNLVLVGVAPPVLAQLLDGDERQVVLGGKFPQIRHALHAAIVVVYQLAEHARRLAARQPRQIHRRLGVARALQHAAGARAQREDVARPGEPPGRRVRVGQRVERRGAVRRAYARARALLQINLQASEYMGAQGMR